MLLNLLLFSLLSSPHLVSFVSLVLTHKLVPKQLISNFLIIGELTYIPCFWQCLTFSTLSSPRSSCPSWASMCGTPSTGETFCLKPLAYKVGVLLFPKLSLLLFRNLLSSQQTHVPCWSPWCMTYFFPNFSIFCHFSLHLHGTCWSSVQSHSSSLSLTSNALPPANIHHEHTHSVLHSLLS